MWQGVHIYEGKTSRYDQGDDREDDTNQMFPDDGTHLSFLVHQVFLDLKVTNTEQWHNLFRMMGTVGGKNVDIISDNGSLDNLVTRKVVKALKLTCKPHKKPY